jgi:hypothetical protein
MFSGMWDHHPDPEEWNKYSETPAPNPQDVGRSSGLVPSSVFHPHTFAVKMPDIFPVSLGDIPILADVILSHVKSRYVQIAGGCWWGCYGSCRTFPLSATRFRPRLEWVPRCDPSRQVTTARACRFGDAWGCLTSFLDSYRGPHDGLWSTNIDIVKSENS